MQKCGFGDPLTQHQNGSVFIYARESEECLSAYILQTNLNMSVALPSFESKSSIPISSVPVGLYGILVVLAAAP